MTKEGVVERGARGLSLSLLGSGETLLQFEKSDNFCIAKVLFGAFSTGGLLIGRCSSTGIYTFFENLVITLFAKDEENIFLSASLASQGFLLGSGIGCGFDGVGEETALFSSRGEFIFTVLLVWAFLI